MTDQKTSYLRAECIPDVKGNLKLGRLIGDSIPEESSDDEAVNGPDTPSYKPGKPSYKTTLAFFQCTGSKPSSRHFFNFSRTTNKTCEKEPLGQFMTVIDTSGAEVNHPERDTSKISPKQFAECMKICKWIEIKEVKEVMERGHIEQHVKRCTLYTG